MTKKQLALFLTMLTTRLDYELALLKQILPVSEQLLSDASHSDLAGLTSIIAELQSAILMLERVPQEEV